MSVALGILQSLFTDLARVLVVLFCFFCSVHDGMMRLLLLVADGSALETQLLDQMTAEIDGEWSQ